MRCVTRRAVHFLLLAIAPSIPATQMCGEDCVKQASQNRSGVVSLTVKKTKKETGAVATGHGTGFVVSPEGYVLTAGHVIGYGDPAYDDLEIEGSIGSLYAQKSPLQFVAQADPSDDVALLKFLDTSHPYTPVRTEAPWDVPIGEPLCSLGFSAPLKGDYKATTGPLSARTGQDDQHGVRNLWTTQIPSNVGESGSPVLRLPDGGVIAVKYGGERVAQGVNYIIPINLAQELLRKYAGVQLSDRAGGGVFSRLKVILQKFRGDKQVVPVGGWDNFEVKVVDPEGKPVKGAKVAWQTPVGGSLTYVAETDDSGVASATNLYTFGTPGSYEQTARIVSDTTPAGFVQADKVVPTGPSVVFSFEQK